MYCVSIYWFLYLNYPGSRTELHVLNMRWDLGWTTLLLGLHLSNGGLNRCTMWPVQPAKLSWSRGTRKSCRAAAGHPSWRAPINGADESIDGKWRGASVWKWKKNKILFSETRCWPAWMFKCLCSTLIKFKPTTLTLFITCHVVSSIGSKCNVICENLSLKKSFQFHSFFLGKPPWKAFVFCVRYSI